MKAIIALVLAFSMNSAFAQTKAKRSATTPATQTSSSLSTTTAPASTATPSTFSRNIRNHLSLSMMLGTASEIKGADLKVDGNKEGAADINTTVPMGWQVQYEHDIARNFEWLVGLTVFKDQTLDSIRLRRNRQEGTIQSMKASFQPWVLSGGAKYNVNDNGYVQASLNIPVLTQKVNGDMESLALNPRLGAHVGGGFNLTKNVAAEFGYQRIAYNMDAKWKNFDGRVKVEGDVAMEGFMLQGRYTF